MPCTPINSFFKSLIVIILLFTINSAKAQKPNIVLIVTDDQGYGDLACHGNKFIKTPNLDKLHSQSVRFNNFHAATTCAPTRAGLMTGKNCNKVGVWHTIIGRELLHKEEVTMAQVFKDAGYVTGIFGKWHLGDNYPFRPQDRGFDEVLIHGGGGVTQSPDYWNNDYFNDTYFHNGKVKKYTGYCTDVWFNNASKFIQKNKKQPFFCYIATNAPHSPYHVADQYSNLYRNNPAIHNANFYGMITHLDQRIGQLIKKLKDEELYDNTIFVFMTDNGTSGGVKFNSMGDVISGYNAGMRGIKGSPYDGGHRVPFFFHWPKGGYSVEKDINALTSYTDVLPTLMDLCAIPNSKNLQFDGISLNPILKNIRDSLSNRTLIVDVQRDEFLIKWKQSAVMTQKWRLVNHTELYNMEQDPGQTKNIISEFPEVVKKLESDYEKWWLDISAGGDKVSRFIIGSPNEKITCLTAHDLHVEKDYPAWSQEMVRAANQVNGYWALEAAEAGNYEIVLRRYPKESKLSLNAVAPKGQIIPGGIPYAAGKSLPVTKGKIIIGTKQWQANAAGSSSKILFKIALPKGELNLKSFLLDDAGNEWPAYYVYIKKVKL